MTWRPTDILRFKGSSPLRVRRVCPQGICTQDSVVYWIVETSPSYAGRTGIRIIHMVPETRLKPIPVI